MLNMDNATNTKQTNFHSLKKYVAILYNDK